MQGAAEVATTSDLCPAAQSVCTADPNGPPCIAAKAVCAETGEVVVGPTVGPIATPTIGAIETPSYLQNLYGDHVPDFCLSAKTVCTATGFEQAACKAAIADAQNANCDLTWYTPVQTGEVLVGPIATPTVGPIATPTVGEIATPMVGEIATPMEIGRAHV